MKKFNFKTESGHDVILETEISEEYYFGLYITCEYTLWRRKWCPPSNLTDKDGQVIKLYSEKFDKICGVTVPEAIYKEIVNEYNNIRHNTGKLILATIRDDDYKIVCQKIGYAIADVSFPGHICYQMPKDMLDAILTYSKNGKIYDFGGLECGPEETTPVVYLDRYAHYWFENFIPENLFDAMFGDGSEKGKTVEYNLELKLVNPYK